MIAFFGFFGNRPIREEMEKYSLLIGWFFQKSEKGAKIDGKLH
jgi:hypothetical protein